jgi:hypothetical protein
LDVSEAELASLAAARAWYDATRDSLTRRVAAALEASARATTIPDGILIRTELPLRRRPSPPRKAVAAAGGPRHR